MRYLLGLLLFISVSASAQYSPTAAKTRFVNGIGLGTKDTATMNAADTVAMIVGRDSLVYFRYKGYWKPLAYNSSLTGYIPYTGATSAIDLNAKTVVNISHLGINTTSVPTILLRAIGDNNSTSRISLRGYSSDANSSSIRVTKFRGTVAAPQAPQSGDNLGKFELAGYGTTSSEGYPQATFEGLATENWGATARGAKIQFKVTPNTTTTQAIALTINQDKSAVFESSITGTSLIKTGGTSSQFLKADGSVTTTIPSGSIDTGRAVTAIATGGSLNKVRDSLAALDALKISGSGTTNYIPKFTSSSAIGNSAITDDGTTITMNSRALIGISATFKGASSYNGTLLIDNTGTTGSGALQIGINGIVKGAISSVGFLQGNTDANIALYSSNGYSFFTNGATSNPAFQVKTDKTSQFDGVVNMNSRLNVNGATDDGSTALNVAGTGKFSGILTVGNDIQTNSNAGYGWLSQNGARVWVIQNGLFQVNTNMTGTSATFSSSVTATKLIVGTDEGYALNITTSGYGALIKSTGSSANIPLVALNSATTGVNNIISLQTDAGSERAVFRYDRTGDRLQLVANGNGLLVTGGATFSSRVNVNGAIDDGSTALNVTGAGKFSNTGGVPSLNLKASDVNFALMSILGNQTGDVNWLLMSGYPSAGDFTIRQSDVVNALIIAKTSGAATFSSLAGTGSRIVVADASGTLSATTTAATSGTYTPTITLVSNTASSTARVCQYMRVGSVVTVSGYVTVTATTPAVSSRIYMTLPISSSFTSTAQAGGAGGVPGGANIGTVIFANSTATTVSMDFLPVAGATDYWFTYTYQIL